MSVQLCEIYYILDNHIFNNHLGKKYNVRVANIEKIGVETYTKKTILGSAKWKDVGNKHYYELVKSGL